MTHLTTLKPAYILLALGLLSACATTTNIVSTQQNQGDFSPYKIFSWADQKTSKYKPKYPVSAQTKHAMNMAIRAELESKGYQFVDYPLAADVWVSYKMGAMDQTRFIKNSEYSAWVWDNGDHIYSSSAFPQPPKEEYIKGAIQLKLIDARTNKMIWQAEASRELSEDEVKAKKTDFASTAKILLEELPEVGK